MAVMFAGLRADEFFGVFVKGCFTTLGAKVIRLPLVFRLRSGVLGIDNHSAHWVLDHFFSFRFHPVLHSDFACPGPRLSANYRETIFADE